MAVQEVRQLSLGQTTALPFDYLRRDPEKSFLYQVVRENWQTFLADAESAGRTLPFYVQREFEGFLQCGVLAHGFVRLKCEGCRHEKLVAFSCKKRGFCPSCGGRRMAEAGLFLANQVFPHVSVRQWVTSFPIPLRYWMASNPKLMGAILSIVSRVIRGFYRKQAVSRGVSGRETGAVTIIQRFGGSINTNIHFHQLWIEGVYQKEQEGIPKYRQVFCPTNDNISEILIAIRKRVVRYLIKRGYLDADEAPAETANGGFESDQPLLAMVMGASTQSRIATGERAGQPVRRVGSFGAPGEKPTFTGALCANLGGFSMHANVLIKPNRKDKLEKLCRYVSRPPVAERRLYRETDGDVGYFLKSKWSDGTFAIRLSPMELIEKLIRPLS